MDVVKTASNFVRNVAMVGLGVLGLLVLYMIYKQMYCGLAQKCKDLCKGLPGCKAECYKDQCKVTGPLGRIIYVDPKQAFKARKEIERLVTSTKAASLSTLDKEDVFDGTDIDDLRDHRLDGDAL